MASLVKKTMLKYHKEHAKMLCKKYRNRKNNNIFDVVNKSLKNDIAFFKQISMQVLSLQINH